MQNPSGEAERLLAGLTMKQRYRLILRIREVLIAAKTTGSPTAAVRVLDLSYLLTGYRVVHRQLSDENERLHLAQQSSGLSAAAAPAGLQAALVHLHTVRCRACRLVLNHAHAKTAGAAQLRRENRRLREELAAADRRARHLQTDVDTLICERDAAEWRLRNHQITERSRLARTSSAGDR